MTNEQINISIAEACGWNPPQEAMGNMTHGGGKFLSSEEWRKVHIPHYCNDLNAMHEAEKMLNKEQWVAYGRELSRLNVFPMVHANAKERTEAFLRTLGKWEE